MPQYPGRTLIKSKDCVFASKNLYNNPIKGKRKKRKSDKKRSFIWHIHENQKFKINSSRIPRRDKTRTQPEMVTGSHHPKIYGPNRNLCNRVFSASSTWKMLASRYSHRSTKVLPLGFVPNKQIFSHLEGPKNPDGLKLRINISVHVYEVHMYI